MRITQTTFFALAMVLFCAFGASAQKARLWTPPASGVWRVNAVDEQTIRWNGRLHLNRSGIRRNTVVFRGYFYWVSDDKTIAGNEYFTGRFDRTTGRLRLVGSRAKSIRGELGTAVYIAQVRHGTRISGNWAGGDSIPGTWSARRISQK